jgi:hypothetical protein
MHAVRIPDSADVCRSAKLAPLHTKTLHRMICLLNSAQTRYVVRKIAFVLNQLHLCRSCRYNRYNISSLHHSLKTLQCWPVGAMVARGPPKAKVVGSSPISVAEDFLFAFGMVPSLF